MLDQNLQNYAVSLRMLPNESLYFDDIGRKFVDADSLVKCACFKYDEALGTFPCWNPNVT
jgi:hypothetical protein